MTPNPKWDPFVGPRPFDEEDADRFFGRSREAWDLTYTGVLSRRLVVVTGAAGVGKTSLLRAGVLPMIRPDTAHVLPVVALDRVAPSPTPATPRNPFVHAALTAWGDPSQGPPAALSTVLRDLPRGKAPYAVAVIDQFDPVVAEDPTAEAHRGELLDQLTAAMEDVPALHLVIVLRTDAVERLAPYEAELSGGDAWRYNLAPLSPGAALEALTLPLRITRRSFEPGVAEALVDQLRTTTLVDKEGTQRTAVAQSVDPAILQIVAEGLWKALPAPISSVGPLEVRDERGVETLLTAHCLRAVIDVAVTSGQSMRALWDWLDTAFVTDLGTRGSAYEGIQETAGMDTEVARAFERHYVLRSERRAGAVWYELHDDLLVLPIRRGREFAAGLAAVAGSSSATSSGTFLAMAESALDSGRLADAEEYARGAVRAGRTDTSRLAEAKAFLGELVFEQARHACGEKVDQLYAVAEGSLQSAAELYETAQNRAGAGRALATLGRLHLERGELSEALAKLRLALDRVDGGELRVRIDFARALWLAGQQQAALGEFTRVLHDDARTVEALVGRGTLSAERGYASAALRDLDAAIRIEPNVAARADVIRARRRAEAQLDRAR